MKNAFEYFILNQNLRGHSVRTIENYKVILGVFIKYLEGKNLIHISDLTISDVNNYHLSLRSRSIKQVTINTYLRHVRAFLNFCYKEELIKMDLGAKMLLPRPESPVIEILSNEEIEIMLSSYNSKTETGLRNICICVLMFDCGLRLQEVCALKTSDINFNSGYIKIELSKGMKGRIVPVGLRARKLLLSYLHKRRLALETDSDYFFLDRYRNPLTKAAIINMFRRLKISSGIVRIHAHLLRHTFATNYLVNGLGDIYELSQILGHEDLKTTEKYLHLANYYKVIQKGNKKHSYFDNL